jgi:acetoin utilization protein AcuB
LLSVWEVSYLVSKIKIKDVMTKHVLTTTEDTPIEEAALILIDNKIGGLPVVAADDSQRVVGMVTVTDMLDCLIHLLASDESTD